MTDEKSNSLTADLNEPASPGDVNEVNPLKAGCTEPEQKQADFPTNKQRSTFPIYPNQNYPTQSCRI